VCINSALGFKKLWESSTEKALKENVIKRLNARKRLN
jgi:hypothetical protein